MTALNDLYAIQSADPDGQEREPTQADYDAFRAWVIAAYGQQAWDDYRMGGWAPDMSVGDWSHLHPDGDDY